MSSKSSFSIYLHIPFCLHKCPYCDFNTYAVSSIPEKEYVSALLSELDYSAVQAAWRKRSVSTIFFGGGTPSLLSPFAIHKIISSVCRLFPVDDSIEISLEVNPGGLGFDVLSGFKDAGINRLSFGAQSVNPNTLKALGRIHTKEDVESSVNYAQQAGFSNISLDLMFGAPGQTLTDVLDDINQVSLMSPKHISLYGLTLEKGTPFYTSYKKKILKLPKENLVLDMHTKGIDLLQKKGLQRYEISNFALPGFEARHNLAYWNANDYLGLGAGAHSFHRGNSIAELYGKRWSNYARPQKYIEKSNSLGSARAWEENLALKDGVFEFCFLGFRKISGLDLIEFRNRFGTDIKTFYGPLIEVLKDRDLLVEQDNKLFLSEKGLLLADSVMENFSAIENLPVAENKIKTENLSLINSNPSSVASDLLASDLGEIRPEKQTA